MAGGFNAPILVYDDTELSHVLAVAARELRHLLVWVRFGNKKRLTLPESVKHWPLRSVQTKLVKMGGCLVGHARRSVFQLAEVAVSREVFWSFPKKVERIAVLHPAPG